MVKMLHPNGKWVIFEQSKLSYLLISLQFVLNPFARINCRDIQLNGEFFFGKRIERKATEIERTDNKKLSQY